MISRPSPGSLPFAVALVALGLAAACTSSSALDSDASVGDVRTPACVPSPEAGTRCTPSVVACGTSACLSIFCNSAGVWEATEACLDATVSPRDGASDAVGHDAPLAEGGRDAGHDASLVDGAHDASLTNDGGHDASLVDGGQDSGHPNDSGQTEDSGQKDSGQTRDSGQKDSGHEEDSGQKDSGHKEDSGHETDAGHSTEDSGHKDSGHPEDSGHHPGDSGHKDAGDHRDA